MGLLKLWLGLSWTSIILLNVIACGNGKLPPADAQNTQGVTQGQAGSGLPSNEWMPLVPTSRYAADLLACLEITDFEDSCSLEQLPLIGQEIVDPDIDDILRRTLVSQAWMGLRFEQVLMRLPNDILQLLGSVTGIVVGADIRPSFYSLWTGAIYLDADYLWLTNAEKRSVSQQPDFQANFKKDIPFVDLWRYVIGNEYAWDPNVSSLNSRAIEDIVPQFAAVMYHELAHANDNFQPSRFSELDTSWSVAQASAQVATQRLSKLLTDYQPLRSKLLHTLGGVMFQDDPVTPALRVTNATQVGVAFQTDGANDLYSYSTPAEDLAMLFEEVMMKFHYNVDREVGFSDVPVNNPRNCAEYIVRWGVRNRIGQPLVRSRVEIALQGLLDRSDVSEYMIKIPDQKILRIGFDWCEGLRSFSISDVQRMPFAAMLLDEITPHPIPQNDFWFSRNYE